MKSLKLILCICGLLLVHLVSFSQAPSMEWNKSYNGTGSESHGHYIITCSDGGFLQVGETGFIDNNSAKMLAIKVNSNGDLVWKKEFGSAGHNLGNCAVEMPDGNYVIAGSLNQNSVLIKLNASNGNTIWSKTHSNSGEDAIEGIDVAEDGGIICVGYMNGTAESTFYVEGQGYIMKADASGNKVWQLDKSAQIGQGYRVKTVSDGYVFQGLDGLSFLVLKTNFSGANQWNNSYGGSGDEHNFGMDVADDGSIYLTGHTQSGTANWDTYTVKINSSGTQQWAKTNGNPRGYDPNYIHDEGWGVRATADGGCLVVAGTGDEYGSYSSCAGSPGCSDQWCVYLIKYSSSGSMQWQQVVTGSGEDWAGEDVTLTCDGGCVVANDNGQFAFTKFASFGNPPSACGPSTAFDLTTSSTTGGSISPSGTNSYPEDTQVQITATANSGYVFDQWTGDASGSSNPLTVTMDTDKNITANFIVCTTTVPNVVGQTQAAAESAISTANLVSSATTQESETVPVGIVISQNPTSGTVPCQSIVNIVISTGPPSNCTQISSSDFESGMQGWIDGGTDCRRNSADAAYANSGTYCIRLVDNTNTSVVTSTPFDASGYESLEVTFSYICNSMDNANEDFWLQISTDGSTFTTVEEWNLGDEFVNGQRYNETVIINSALSATTQIRFRCDASGNSDYVYIDDVVIQGCGAAPCTAIVPDVVDLAQATAEASITAANLTVGTISTQSSETVAVGNVISQNPAFGQSVSCGSTVDIVVSTGPSGQTWPGWYFIENKYHSYPRLQDDGTTTPKVVTIADNSDACRWQFIEAGSGLFYIQNASGMRLSDGNGTNDPLLVNNTVTTDRVKWSVIESSTAGEYWITSNATNSQPRIRTDNTTIPDMQGTGSTGNWTKWEIVSTTDPGSGPTQYTLTTNATSGGSVTTGGTYDEGTIVQISATPDAGYQFDNWSGDASGSINPLSVTMDGNKSITANFSAVSANEWIKIDDRDAAIVYGGNWYQTNPSSAYMQTATLTQASGLTATYTFTGTQIRFYAWQYDTPQGYSVSIDGGSSQSVNVSSGSEQSVLAYESSVLSSSNHTIVITTASGEPHLDAIEYYGIASQFKDAVGESFAESNNHNLHLYPNPVGDYLNLDIDGIQGKTQIAIFNLQGMKVYSENLYMESNITKQLSLQELTNGNYIIHIKNNENSFTKRFVVMK